MFARTKITKKLSGVLLTNDHLVLLYRLMGVMLVFTLCRILFWVYNRELIPNSSPFEAATLYLGGLRFDLSAVLMMNILFILFSTFPAPWRHQLWWKKLTFVSYIVPNTLGVIANCVDFEFYKFTLRRTTSSVFATFENEQNKATLFFRFMADYWHIYLIAIALIALLYLIYRKTDTSIPARAGWRFYIGNSVALLVIFFVAVAGIRGGFDRTTRPITLSNAGQYVTEPNQIPVVLNTPFSIFRTIGKKSFDRKAYFADAQELENIYTPVHKPQPSHPFRADNVVIFILESWGKEVSGALNPELENGSYKGYTPFLDSLLANGLSFKYSFANGKKSIDGMPSVLASIPSLVVPYFLTHQSGNRINSIASLLKEKGYQSAFFHGAPNGSMGFQAFANIAGFDQYFGMTEYNNDADMDGYWGIWDEPFFQFFAQTMNQLQTPFVTAIFSVSSHHPFKVPEKYEGKLREGPLPIYRSVNYTDLALEKFFETARQMPWFQNTLFVITADHTQASLSHAEYQNSTGRFEVPILFYKPDGSLGEFDATRIAQQIDIMPSILGYLGYDEPYIAFGNDLFAASPADGFAINYLNDSYQWFAGKHVLVATDESVYGMYDFTRDRAMHADLSATLPGVRQQLETRLKGFIQQYNHRMLDNRLTVPDSPAFRSAQLSVDTTCGVRSAASLTATSEGKRSNC